LGQERETAGSLAELGAGAPCAQFAERARRARSGKCRQ